MMLQRYHGETTPSRMAKPRHSSFWPQIWRACEAAVRVRKEQAKLIGKGMSFKDALDSATKDHSIRERHFVTPMAVSAMASGSGGGSHRGRDRSRSAPNRSGRGGKGRRDERRDTGASSSWGINSPHEKCTGTCDRAHVCRLCLGNHPAFQCTRDH